MVKKKDDDEEVEIHASAFVPSEDNEDGELLPIEDDAEWEMIEEMLNTFLAEEDEDRRVIHMCTDGTVQAVPFFHCLRNYKIVNYGLVRTRIVPIYAVL